MPEDNFKKSNRNNGLNNRYKKKNKDKNRKN